MEIKDRIAKLGNYFKEMQITTLNGKRVIYVVAQFPNGWIIDENLSDKFKVLVKESGEEEGQFYFVTEIENGEGAVFDAIDYSIKAMKDAMERAKLLNDKVRELKAIFEDESISLETLKTLNISYSSAVTSLDNEITPLPKKRGKKKETKKDE